MLYLHLHVKNHDMSRQGPLKMDGTLPKISNLKLQGRGAPIPPWGWVGVDGMDLDHNRIQNM